MDYLTFSVVLCSFNVCMFDCRLLFFFKPSVSIPEGGLKIDENKLKGMMLSPCSQGPAGCRVAEQH